MIMETDVQPSTELVPLNTIRVETALSRYPVHRLARKGSIDISIREGNKNGTETTWEVDYSKKHGQPGPLAYKIDTLIINRRLEEAIRPIPKLLKLGSLKELCRELGMAETGGNTNQIKKSLFQNALAGITAKTRYRQNDGSERTLEAVFTRYSVILTGERLPDGRKADAVYVMLNEIFMQVINGAITRPLDYDYLKSLPPAPQRFYEVLSYQMYAALKYDRPRAKLVYSEFCAHAPQTRHTDWERVRSQMNKVHRPHRDSGYIARVDFQQTTADDGKPDWIMFYQPGPTARAEFRAFTKRGGPNVLEIESSEPQPDKAVSGLSEIEQELVNRGVTETAARELVRTHSEEKILQQIEILDWRLEGKKADKIDDPAAWLVSAIKSPTGHAAPKGFVSKAERQRREEAKQAKERQAAAKRRQDQDQEARERAARQKVDAYLKQLDQAERIALEAKVLAAASPTDKENYDSHVMAKFRDTLMLGMIREYLAGKPELEQIAVEA
jgi:hypothetical protein